ncbi:hypothetical protein L873DRAFT_1840577 [Choiromyces venosus 120613-1]|uniref:Uncharacterized protein n=1 Tax=Choiromyces venosus 120613-1 TaxID=1336337 RepID=A0A3N4K5S8_9PEZI|nr:hypothetical protein L873DRAFT_1840577 [Choiromyces venosus 120613-1]
MISSMHRKRRRDKPSSRSVHDEVLAQQDSIVIANSSPRVLFPRPPMDDKRWEKLIHEDRVFDISIYRETIPQALQELMSEKTTLKIFRGKVYYFWAYMFFFQWGFSELERERMFQVIKPSGYIIPQWIGSTDVLIGGFQHTYKRFNTWMWERIVRFADKYRCSEAGIAWAVRFKSASKKKNREIPQPDILSGIEFGVLEMQEVFTPLLSICELKRARHGDAYWIGEKDGGEWWAARLKQKFLEAVAYYLVEDAKDCNDSRLMLVTLRKCAPVPPLRHLIRPPVRRPGKMNWPELDTPFDQLQIFNASLVRKVVPRTSKEGEMTKLQVTGLALPEMSPAGLDLAKSRETTPFISTMTAFSALADPLRDPLQSGTNKSPAEKSPRRQTEKAPEFLKGSLGSSRSRPSHVAAAERQQRQDAIESGRFPQGRTYPLPSFVFPASPGRRVIAGQGNREKGPEGVRR